MLFMVLFCNVSAYLPKTPAHAPHTQSPTAATSFLFAQIQKMSATKRQLFGGQSGHVKRPRCEDEEKKESVGAEPIVKTLGRSIPQTLEGPNKPKRQVTIHEKEGKVFKSIKAYGNAARLLYNLYTKQFTDGPCPTRAEIFYVGIEPPETRKSKFWTVDIWKELVVGRKLEKNTLTEEDAREIFDNTVKDAKWWNTHNDIKPANFFIVGGCVKAIDFGHAITQQNDPDQDTGDLSFLSQDTRRILEKKRAPVGVDWDLLLLAVTLFHFGAGVELERVPGFQEFTNRRATVKQSKHADMELELELELVAVSEAGPESDGDGHVCRRLF